MKIWKVKYERCAPLVRTTTKILAGSYEEACQVARLMMPSWADTICVSGGGCDSPPQEYAKAA